MGPSRASTHSRHCEWGKKVCPDPGDGIRGKRRRGWKSQLLSVFVCVPVRTVEPKMGESFEDWKCIRDWGREEGKKRLRTRLEMTMSFWNEMWSEPGQMPPSHSPNIHTIQCFLFIIIQSLKAKSDPDFVHCKLMSLMASPSSRDEWRFAQVNSDLFLLIFRPSLVSSPLPWTPFVHSW